MCVAEAMPCECRTRRDARRQDMLRVARRRRAPAHARATSAMPAVKSRRFLCTAQVHAKTLRFPIVFYGKYILVSGIQITGRALTRASDVQF